MSNKLLFDFEIRSLGRESIPDLIGLQREIGAALPDPEIFILHDESYFSVIFDQPKAVLGAFLHSRLIAYCFILIPGLSPANLGREMNLPDCELSSVAHLQAAAVHPHFRGHGLQKRIMEEQLEAISEQGYRHAFCTVSPKNPVSLKNVLSSGLLIRALRPKQNGWCRYIMHRDLGGSMNSLKTITDRETIPKDLKAISISDLRVQADLLRAGYTGFKIIPGGSVRNDNRAVTDYKILFAGSFEIQ